MRKTWTKEEIAFIREHKTQMTNKQLARKFGCTESQLYNAMKKHKLTRTTKEYYELMENITGQKFIRPSYYHGLFWK